MSDLLELMTLQAIDDDLDAARAQLASIETQLSADEGLRAAAERLEAANGVVAELRKRQRTGDAAIADLEARIAREEQTLYGGSIKQFKDLQALEGDIAHLKADRSALEDGALAILSEIDDAVSELDRLAAEIETLRNEWDASSATLRAAAARLEPLVLEKDRERTEQLDRITAGSVRLYEGLRKRKAGKAVVRVAGSSCSACRVAIPDPIRRRIVNSPTLVQCPHCERILALG